MMTDNQPLWDQLRSTPAAKKPRRSRKVLEASVLKECREWLLNREYVVYVERRNTGAVQFANRYVPFGVTGGADLWCLIEVTLGSWEDAVGTLQHVEIECKRRDGKGRMSDDQKKFQARCKEIGVPYFVVTSAEDLERQLTKAEIIS